MKRIIGIMTLIGLAFIGCSQLDNNITEPEIYSLPKTTECLNITPNASLTETIVASAQIDGAIGGQITIQQDIIDSTGRVINIYANLVVPIGAYQGIKTISMEVDWKNASVDFNPSMQFDNSLTFGFMLTNLPLAQMGYRHGDSVKFVYIDPSGNTFPILSKEVSMNYYWGRLRVNNARIQHFSRYGFIRKGDNPIVNILEADKSPY